MLVEEVLQPVHRRDVILHFPWERRFGFGYTSVPGDSRELPGGKSINSVL